MTDAVDLWAWRLAGGDVRLLSGDEVDRAARFAFARDRDHYIAGRARLREILAGYVGGAPGAVRFRYGPQGKPEVDGLHFNLSHTGDRAALAVAEAPVGIDIEEVHPVEEGIAEVHFAPAEYRTLTALPADERLAAFYRGWTRKEAYLKARGTGLATDLASFEVTLGPGEPARLLRCASGDAAAWRLEDLAIAAGVAGALALRTGGPPPRLRWRQGP